MDEISENNEIKDSHFSCHWLYINNFGTIGSGSGSDVFPRILVGSQRPSQSLCHIYFSAPHLSSYTGSLYIHPSIIQTLIVSQSDVCKRIFAWLPCNMYLDEGGMSCYSYRQWHIIEHTICSIYRDIKKYRNFHQMTWIAIWKTESF